MKSVARFPHDSKGLWSVQVFPWARRIRQEAPEEASEPPALAALQLNQRSSHVQHLGAGGKGGFVHDWENFQTLNSSYFMHIGMRVMW